MKNVGLVTGASSGIGKEIARIHALKGRDLVLVARRKDELEQLKSEFEKEYGIHAFVVVADLMSNDGPMTVYNEVEKQGLFIEYLFNNAGLGGYGYFHERTLKDELDMINLNIKAVVELTHLFLPKMIENKKGKILNTSSTAGFLPGPLQTNYYATKAFVNSFSAGLDQEIRRHGITVTALCPGPVKTGFESAAGMQGSMLFKNAATAESTASKGYKAMESGRLEVITDFPMKIGIKFFMPFLPNRMILKAIEKFQRVK